MRILVRPSNRRKCFCCPHPRRSLTSPGTKHPPPPTTTTTTKAVCVPCNSSRECGIVSLPLNLARSSTRLRASTHSVACTSPLCRIGFAVQTKSSVSQSQNRAACARTKTAKPQTTATTTECTMTMSAAAANANSGENTPRIATFCLVFGNGCRVCTQPGNQASATSEKV